MPYALGIQTNSNTGNSFFFAAPNCYGSTDRLAYTTAVSRIEVRSGPAALLEAAAAEDGRYVMAAIVGAAGLEATLAAVHAGKRVLLANKEALVMTGRIFMDAVRDAAAARHR